MSHSTGIFFMISRPVDAYRVAAEHAGLGPCWFEPPLNFDFLSVDERILRNAAGVIFSSQTAVESVSKSFSNASLKGKPCWVVGSATAVAARCKGLDVRAVVDGGGERFVEAVSTQKVTLPTGKILWFCPQEVAFPLNTALAKLGVHIEPIITYRTSPAKRCSSEAEQWLLDHNKACVALFSQICATAYDHWRQDQLRHWVPSMVFAIGPRVVERLSKVEKSRCIWPKEASRASFIKMLHSFSLSPDDTGSWGSLHDAKNDDYIKT